MNQLLLKLTLIIIFIINSFCSFGQWVNTNGIYKGTYIYTFGTDGKNIYAGSQSGGVYVSKDEGNSWYTVNNGLPSVHGVYIEDFTSSGQNDIYVCTNAANGSIYKSTNEGDSWQWVNYGLNDYALCVAAKGNDLYAGTANGIYKSINGGNEWFKLNNIPEEYIFEIEISSDGIIYAGGRNNLYISTNDGQSWSKTNPGPNSNTVYALESLNKNVYIAYNDALYKYSKEGIWTKLAIQGILEMKVNGNSIYLATWDGVYVSSDEGTTWAPKPIAGEMSDVNAIIAMDSYILASPTFGEMKGIVKSTNGGNSWAQSNNGLLNAKISTLLYKDSYLFAGVDFYGIMRSEDEGATWTSVDNGINLNISDVSFISNLLQVGSMIFVVTSEGLFKTNDNGNLWEFAGLGSNISHLAYDGVNLYALSGNRLFKSANYGASWSNALIGNSINYIYSLECYDGKVYIGTDKGLFVSSDAINWTSLLASSNGLAKDIVVSEGRIIICGNSTMISDDKGLNWKMVHYGQERTIVKVGQDLLLGTELEGILISKDNGDTWQKYNTGLWDTFIDDIITDGKNVYAGTFESSLYKRRISDQDDPLLPTQFILSGTASGCPASIPPLRLSGSEKGVTYQVLKDGSKEGDPIPGTGEPIFIEESGEGEYTVVAQRGADVETMHGIAVINYKEAPLHFNLTGGGAYCYGEANGLPVALSGSETGFKYQLKNGDEDIGEAVTGPGNPIAFGKQLPGTYTVVAIHPSTHCMETMNGSVDVIENPRPSKYTLVEAGEHCSEENGVTINLSGSQPGVNYKVMIDNVLTEQYYEGIADLLPMVFRHEGLYKILAVTEATQCSDTMIGTVLIKSSPEPYHISVGGIYCAESSGYEIELESSSARVKYQLVNENGYVGDAIKGTGTQISFGLQQAGVYKIIATDTVTACWTFMIGEASVNEDICTGLESASDNDQNFEFYPNPTSGVFSVNYSGNLEEIVLVNALGQKEYFYNNEVITSFKGMVFMTVKTDKGIFVKKVLIQ